MRERKEERGDRRRTGWSREGEKGEVAKGVEFSKNNKTREGNGSEEKKNVKRTAEGVVNKHGGNVRRIKKAAEMIGITLQLQGGMNEKGLGLKIPTEKGSYSSKERGGGGGGGESRVYRRFVEWKSV